MSVRGVRTNIVAPAYAGAFDHMALPVSGCLAFFALGGDAQRSITNGVRGGAPGLIVGAPGINPYSMRFQGGASFLQFPMAEREVGTLVVVPRSVDANSSNSTRPTFIGSAVGAEEGVEIYVSAATGVRLGVGVDEGAGPSAATSVLVTTPTDWHCWMGAWDLTRRALFDVGTDTSDIDEFAGGTTRLPASNQVCVGGGPGVIHTGLCDVAFAGLFDHPLDYTERRALYVVLKRLCADRGISI